MASPELSGGDQVGSYNSYLENHPEATVADYSEALAQQRQHVAQGQGVPVELLHGNRDLVAGSAPRNAWVKTEHDS